MLDASILAILTALGVSKEVSCNSWKVAGSRVQTGNAQALQGFSLLACEMNLHEDHLIWLLHQLTI
eukprot:4548524-Amphidinium_carterae.1